MTTPSEVPQHRQHDDLEQLKRQAKELLRAYRAGDAAAAALVRQHYGEAGAEGLQLADAQRALARSLGFANWQALKADVDRATVAKLIGKVRAGDVAAVERMVAGRGELVHMETSPTDEHMALHHAVLCRDAAMVRVLMARGASARKGIYPHRDATTAYAIARDRGYDELLRVMEEEEQRRRETAGGGSVQQDRISEAIRAREHARAMALIEEAGATSRGVMPWEAVDRDGWTALHLAAATLDDALVAWLVARGADVKRVANGRTPLDMAVGLRWRSPEDSDRFHRVARVLSEAGAPVTLRAAVVFGDAAYLRNEHAAGRLVNPIDPPGGLLSIAVRFDRVDMLELLIDLGLDVNERLRVAGVEEELWSAGMPLWHAAGTGRHAFAELLLGRGADPNVAVYASGTPVFQAYGQDDQRMIDLLACYGGKADAVTVGLYRRTDLARQMLTGTLENGRLKEDTYFGRTTAEQLLWGSACGGDPEAVAMALSQVDWPAGDRRWYAMLEQPLRYCNHGSGHWARPAWDRGAYLTCFGHLLARSGAGVIGRHGRTILHEVAAVNGPTEAERVVFAEMLLDAGASLQVREDLLQSTPLGWACRWGRVELARLLVARGADVKEPDAEAWARPLAWAQRGGFAEIVALLERASQARS